MAQGRTDSPQSDAIYKKTAADKNTGRQILLHAPAPPGEVVY
jgi:hypothetical protein